MLTVNVPRDAVVRALWEWKYLTTYPTAQDAIDCVTEAEIREAVERYQAFNGLKPDGVIGKKTIHQMANPLRCGLPDMMADQVCAWPMKRVTYLPLINLPGLSDTEAVRAFDTACQQWNAVCGIQLERVLSGPANIVAKSGKGQANNLDGRGGTLAWSYLPCGAGPATSLKQMYDESESWAFDMAVAVICHEIGHAIGLPHSVAGNLMAPYYNAQVIKPQAGDIAEVVKRYGKPIATPSPPPAGPDDKIRATVECVVNGVTYIASGDMRRKLAGLSAAVYEDALS